MRKTMPRTAKKPTKSKLIKKLDIVFSKYIRLSNADKNGFCTCVTCNRKYHWKNIQAGHFMSRKHYSTRWDEDNVKPQCCGCNMFKQGEQYKYSLFLGSELSNELYLKSKEVVKFSSYDIEQMIEHYNTKLKTFL